MIIIGTFICLFIDIISKLIVNNLMDVNESVLVIKNFFNITYVRNDGVAWSMLSGKTGLIILVSLLIIGFLGWYIYRNKPKNKFEMIAYSFILGGSIGNLVDRIVYGYVIDFFDFNIFGYDYPIFNFADIFIVCGVILLIIDTLRGNKNDSNRIRKNNKNR